MEQLVILTRDEFETIVIRAGVNSIELYEKMKADSAKDNERRKLTIIVRQRFPDYNKRNYLEKFRTAIEKGELGGYDRYNHPIVSFNELKKFIYGK